jgi:translation initiation factor 6 (eIF-6)
MQSNFVVLAQLLSRTAREQASSAMPNCNSVLLVTGNTVLSTLSKGIVPKLLDTFARHVIARISQVETIKKRYAKLHLIGYEN